jgi:hypothetical protein
MVRGYHFQHRLWVHSDFSNALYIGVLYYNKQKLSSWVQTKNKQTN